MSPYQQVLQSLELLRDEVRDAQEEIKDLRKENIDLRLELAVLKTKQTMWSGGIAAAVTIGLSFAKNWIK